MLPDRRGEGGVDGSEGEGGGNRLTMFLTLLPGVVAGSDSLAESSLDYSQVCQNFSEEDIEGAIHQITVTRAKDLEVIVNLIDDGRWKRN